MSDSTKKRNGVRKAFDNVNSNEMELKKRLKGPFQKFPDFVNASPKL